MECNVVIVFGKTHVNFGGLDTLVRRKGRFLSAVDYSHLLGSRSDGFSFTFWF